jgi:hypothetical protein
VTAPPDYIVPILEQIGFLEVSRIRGFLFDMNMVTALVERWRPETHTFHLPVGEVTVTLEDVAVHLGVPIHGRPIVKVDPFDVEEICFRLLGAVPQLNPENPRERNPGRCVTNVFLQRIYTADLPYNPTEEDLNQRARAYILRMIGGLLMPDKSSSKTHLKYLSLLENIFQITPSSVIMSLRTVIKKVKA